MYTESGYSTMEPYLFNSWSRLFPPIEHSKSSRRSDSLVLDAVERESVREREYDQDDHHRWKLEEMTT